MILNPYRFKSGGAAGTLRDAILALNPSHYFRHAEAAGATVMENEVGTDGAYSNSPSLGNSAIYPGGPQCAFFDNPSRGQDSNALPATVNVLSLLCVVKFTVLTGMRGLISRDPNTNRKWQWRTNGTSIEFVRIVGGASTTATPAGVIGTTKAHLLGLTLNGAALKFYVDGAQVHSATLGSVQNLGGTSQTQIGYCAGAGGIPAAAYFSESAMFPAELLGSEMAALYSASGL